MPGETFRLGAEELRFFEQHGYVVREGIFDPGEVRAVCTACEALVEELLAFRRGTRQAFGSYVFETDDERGVVIKWEGDTDVVHGIEPFAHLSRDLASWGRDPRFVEPMIDVLQTDEPELFTEKLNLKRARHGGENPLHQDFPYWVPVAQNASQVATAILFLDDATLENGCLQVVPGSHREGAWVGRTDSDRFGENEIDQAKYADRHLVSLEVPSGTVVMFGAMLAHQSAPNTSDRDRRALLYSYQPPGRPTQLDALRARLERTPSSEER